MKSCNLSLYKGLILLMYTSQDTLEMCSREIEFKSILFSLVYFHAVVIERRKFGPQGWNRSYPFNTGDLTISVYVLFNYLEANAKVPWTDLRYLFGEIMYGGHITDDWDRRLCRTYLEEFMMPEQVSMLFPSLEMTLPHTLGRGRRANKHIVVCGTPGFLGVFGACTCNRYHALSPPPQRVEVSLFPRTLPCFQCYTQKRGKAW